MRELDQKALEAARTAFNEVSGNPTCDDPIGVAVSAYLSALPSAPAVEGVEPVAWRYRGDFIGAKLPWQHTDQKWLADRQEEDGEEVEPLYPASAISRLVKERDEARTRW
jgi:hypothetical protein